MSFSGKFLRRGPILLSERRTIRPSPSGCFEAAKTALTAYELQAQVALELIFANAGPRKILPLRTSIAPPHNPMVYSLYSFLPFDPKPTLPIANLKNFPSL